MSSYWLNGPVTLLVVLLGALLNMLTIYVLSAHTLYTRQKKTSSVSQNCISQQSRRCVSSSSIKEHAINTPVHRNCSSPTYSPDEERGMSSPLMGAESPLPKRPKGPVKKISFSLKETMGTSTEEGKPKLGISTLARQASLISRTSTSGVAATRPRVYTFSYG
uniref:Uncharacterized protein n=1 Tax=Ditylenchus dipsaci TaxID=166011 RepID=A0A915E897_9BILA